MPNNLIKTPQDETAWNHAKQAVVQSTGQHEGQFGPHHWSIVTSIFNRMKQNPTVAPRGPSGPRLASDKV